MYLSEFDIAAGHLIFAALLFCNYAVLIVLKEYIHLNTMCRWLSFKRITQDHIYYIIYID